MKTVANLSDYKSTTRGTGSPSSIILAVGGGKGGVGKSFLSTNIGIFLANMGFNTIIVDCDLGAPNVHTCLGEAPPKLNFHQFLSGRLENFEAAAVATQFAKLRFIAGGNDHQELANITIHDQSRLMSAIYTLNADFTILDLSAGTHTSTLDFFLMADRHLITLTPDPTSIENAYRFMKAAFFRRIKRFERQLGLEALVASIMAEPEKNEIRVPADLLSRILKENPEAGRELEKFMHHLRFELVINQTRSTKDVQLANSVSTVSKKYFGLPAGVLGHLDYDNAVWHALRKRRPLILEFPNSPLYAQILAIARDLASPHLKKAVI